MVEIVQCLVDKFPNCFYKAAFSSFLSVLEVSFYFKHATYVFFLVINISAGS